MNIVLALLPALAWGLFPLVVSKIGGSPANQILGIGLGSTLVGIIVILITRVQIPANIFWLSLLSGILWSTGQVGQFVSYKHIGVSKTMPISTGFQLVGNSLLGVVMFGEWPAAYEKGLGFLALVLIIIGISLTAITDSNSKYKVTTKNILFLLVTTIGYWVYSTFPKTVNASAQTLYFPQMLGILIGSLLFLIFSKQFKEVTNKVSWLDAIGGVLFGLGALTYMFSAKINGVTSAFIFSQLSVVLSTLGGMYFLHEKKTGRELRFTYIGLILVIVGSIITGII